MRRSSPPRVHDGSREIATGVLPGALHFHPQSIPMDANIVPCQNLGLSCKLLPNFLEFSFQSLLGQLSRFHFFQGLETMNGAVFVTQASVDDTI